MKQTLDGHVALWSLAESNNTQLAEDLNRDVEGARKFGKRAYIGMTS